MFKVLFSRQEDMRYCDGFQTGFIQYGVISVVYGDVGLLLRLLEDFSGVLFMYWVGY